VPSVIFRLKGEKLRRQTREVVNVYGKKRGAEFLDNPNTANHVESRYAKGS
jgi:hypothetical protein